MINNGLHCVVHSCEQEAPLPCVDPITIGQWGWGCRKTGPITEPIPFPNHSSTRQPHVGWYLDIWGWRVKIIHPFTDSIKPTNALILVTVVRADTLTFRSKERVKEVRSLIRMTAAWRAGFALTRESYVRENQRSSSFVGSTDSLSGDGWTGVRVWLALSLFLNGE